MGPLPGVEIIEEEGGKKKARLTYEIDDEQKAIDVDKVLVTVGRRANLEGWGLEKTGVRLGNNGRFIRTDRRCSSSSGPQEDAREPCSDFHVRYRHGRSSKM